MTRAFKFLLIFLLAWAVLASAAPLDLSQWKYRKSIPLTPGDGLAVVKLDREVYEVTAERYFVLRVVRDGNEIPFVMDTPGFEGSRVYGQTVFDETIVPGVGLQFTVRAGERKHDAINLVTTLHNFRSRVRIETSEDGRRWGVARDNGAIFDFSQDGREFQSTDVSYPVSTRRFLRVTIFGWTKTGTVTSAFVAPQVPPRPQAFEPLATITPQISEDPATKSTLVLIDLGSNGLNASMFFIETSSRQFQRAFELESSTDGRFWAVENGGVGVLARLPGPGFKEEHLTISTVSERRYYRIRIYNQDDAPIQVDRVRVEGVVRLVKFLAPSAGSYWLYYGSPPTENAPNYDLEKVLARQQLPEHRLTLGAQEPNPAYRPPPVPKKPWSEQHPAILYTVLGGAVLALGIATFRFAARLRTSS